MKNIFSCLMIICLSSCSGRDSGKQNQMAPLPNSRHKIETVATFVDSINIARPGFNKIYLERVTIDDSIPSVFVRFYSKKNSGWQLKNEYEIEQWTRDLLDVEITDFNNDTCKDITYIKGTGGRGGNVLMDLFIYDKSGDSLTYIRNSDNYPNLYYNKETNSINAYILSGGNETVFMHLKDKMLQPFARIFQEEKQVTVYEYDSTGKSRVVYVDSNNNYDFFARFVNYKPLKEKK